MIADAPPPPHVPEPPADAEHPRERGVAGQLRRAQREKEEALGPLGRIELALALGLRAKALRAMVARHPEIDRSALRDTCASLRLDRKLDRALLLLDDEPSDPPP